MRLFRGLYNLPSFPKGSVVSIGAFDGIHLGHQAIIHQVLWHAERLGLPSLLICFEPLPREYFAPDEAPLRVLGFHDKYRVLKHHGIDAVLRIHFDYKVASLSAEDFFDRVFIQALNMQHLVVGDDFRFGSNREGGKQLFLEATSKHGFGFSQAESVVLKGSRISSTRIRESLGRGDFSEVGELLGRPYAISGKVVSTEAAQARSGLGNVTLCCHTALSGTYLVRLAFSNAWSCYAVVMLEPGTARSGINRYRWIKACLLDVNAELPRQGMTIEFLCRLAEQGLNTVENPDAGVVARARQWLLENAAG